MTVRNMPFLAPAAFTMVMGTGALAMATLEMSQIFPPLYWFAQFLNILNYALFFLLALWAALSWPKNVPHCWKISNSRIIARCIRPWA